MPQRVGDRQVRDRARVEHRPVGLLAPEESHDVVRRHGVGQGRRQLGHPSGDHVGEGLADAERSDVALHDPPGTHHVGSEVHEADNQVVATDGLGEDVGGEAVLKAHAVPPRSDPTAHQIRRRLGVVALDRDGEVLGPRGQLIGGDGLHADVEVLDRSFYGQPVAIDRSNVIGVGVAQDDVMAAPGHVSTNGAADRAGTDDRQLH